MTGTDLCVMTGTDLCVNKPQSVPVIFEPPCTQTNSISFL